MLCTTRAERAHRIVRSALGQHGERDRYDHQRVVEHARPAISPAVEQPTIRAPGYSPISSAQVSCSVSRAVGANASASWAFAPSGLFTGDQPAPFRVRCSIRIGPGRGYRPHPGTLRARRRPVVR
jgi:hypothetical protein